MTQFDTLPDVASPAAPNDCDAAPAKGAPQIDVDRVVWDPEYREEVLEALKTGA